MIDKFGREPISCHHDNVTYRCYLEQFGGEGEGQPDATVGGRITRHDAGMQRRTGTGKSLHPGHWGVVIKIGVVGPLLLENAEHAGLGRVARPPA